jgi:sugar (pentulose or hexulose) kinase
MTCVLVIDLGTSYFKAGLFDAEGIMRALARVAAPKSEPASGRCEMPVEEFWRVLRECVRQLCAEAGIKPEQITALSYASQANSFVLLDESAQPLTPIVLWTDRRCDELPQDLTLRSKWEDLTPTTGFGFCPEDQCVGKLRWFRRHEPAIWQRTRHVLTLSDYLVFGMTGNFTGDSGTASMLGLWDIAQNHWCSEAFKLAGLSKELFCQPGRPGQITGRVAAEGAARLGLSEECLLVLGSLDHHMAAIGAGCGILAQVADSSGTVEACIRFGPQLSPKKSQCTGPHVEPGHLWQLAFDPCGASALETFAGSRGMTVPDLLNMAEKVPPGAYGLVASNKVEGTVFQDSEDREHDTGDYARALLEGNARIVRRLLENLFGGGLPEKVIAVGGGARNATWLQIKADILGMDFLTVNCKEPACRGAALLAATGAGWFQHWQQASRRWVQVENVFHPDPERHENYSEWLSRI